MKDNKKPPVLQEAHKIFTQETFECLKVAQDIFQSEAKPSEEELDQIRSSFHRLRGGAGILGFSTIAEYAAEIEETLEKTGELSEQDQSSLVELIEKLHNRANEVLHK